MARENLRAVARPKERVTSAGSCNPRRQDYGARRQICCKVCRAVPPMQLTTAAHAEYRRSTTAFAGSPIASVMVAREGSIFPRSQSYLVSAFLTPRHANPSVMPLHGLLHDLPCAAISPTRSVLIAIISR